MGTKLKTENTTIRERESVSFDLSSTLKLSLRKSNNFTRKLEPIAYLSPQFKTSKSICLASPLNPNYK